MNDVYQSSDDYGDRRRLAEGCHVNPRNIHIDSVTAMVLPRFDYGVYVAITMTVCVVVVV